MKTFRLPLLGSLLLIGTMLANQPSLQSAIVIQDDFDNSNPTTGATTLPVASWSRSGNLSESGGILTISTDAIGGGSAMPNQWSGSVLYTNSAHAPLNLYQNTISVAMRELTLSSSGDHAGTQARFRFGFIPRDNQTYTNVGANPAAGGNSFGQFYNNGNDGISIELTNNSALTATVFSVRSKKNASTSATDPNVVAPNGSGTLSFIATGLDFTATATEWSLTFYGADSATSVHSGTWSLGDMESWGNATDGWGNSSFIMGVQNMGAIGASAPTDSFNGWTTATIGSLSVTSVPEPSRALLAFGGLLLLAAQRRR
ncbi:hypothetical protein [Phragmitibacter flavus]|nr:hypothetical protein [Phragmitibacter flavus]